MTGLEGIAVAALVKGVDFLFGEAKEIMKERREARKARGEAEEVETPESEGITVSANEVKETVIKANPKSLYLNDFPQEVKHCIDQIHAYRNNKRLLESQVSQYGGFVFAPIITQNQIRTNEDQIKR